MADIGMAWNREARCPASTGAWIGGNLEARSAPYAGGIYDSPAGVRISTISSPRYSSPTSEAVRLLAKESWMKDFETEKIKKKLKADKWAKRLKVIKALLHKIKEKLKE